MGHTDKFISFGSYEEQFAIGFIIMNSTEDHWHIIVDVGFWYVQFTFKKTKGEIK